MKKQPIIKDERTEKLDGKIAGEVVLGMTLFLAISIFSKAYLLHLSLGTFLPELILLIGVGIYAMIRRLSLGVDIRDMATEEKWPKKLVGGLIFALFVAGIDFLAQRESLTDMLSPWYLLKLGLAMLFFVLGNLTLDKVSLYFNRKGQEKLERELEAEE